MKRYLLFVSFIFALSGLLFAENPPKNRTSDGDANTSNSADINKPSNPTAPVNIYVSPAPFPQAQAKPNQNSTDNQIGGGTFNKWSDPIVLLTIILALTNIALVIVSQNQSRLIRKNAVSIQRAFVFPKLVNFGQALEPGTNKLLGIQISVIWENSGDTPTRKGKFHLNLRLDASDLPYVFDFPDAPSDHQYTLIPPKSTIAVNSNTLINPTQIDGIIAGTLRCHIWGWAEYNDVFSKTRRHRTEFCYILGIQKGTPTDPNGFSFLSIPYSKYNGANEECMKQPQTT